MDTKRKERAIVFDFDGTLVCGRQDKGTHLMYSAWVACYESGFREFLHPDALSEDVDRLLRAYLTCHGAPRFQQLTVFVNALINNMPVAFKTPAELNISQGLQARYEDVRTTYNAVYSSLNDAAAETYWRPFPSVKDTLGSLAENYDLYIASGLPQDLLKQDFVYHDFDHAHFLSIFGSNTTGGSDKGDILKRIKAQGYKEMLFVGDSTTDLGYASAAHVNFFRIQKDADFQRLLSMVPEGMPNEDQHWTFTPGEVDFFKRTATYLIEAYCSGKSLSAKEMTDFINNEPL